MKIRKNQKNKPVLMPLLLLAVCGFIAGAGNMKAGAQSSDLHETYDLSQNGVVSVSNVSGNIRVTAWDGTKVKVDAVKRGRNEEYNQVEIQVNATPDKIEIRTVYHRGRGAWSNNVTVDYDLKVPKTVVLSPLNSISGDITVVGPVARLIARSTSGNVAAQDVNDTASLASTSGNVKAERIKGELRAHSTSGNVVVNDASSRLIAQTSSGSVTVTRVGDDATVGASSGNVSLERIGGRVVAQSNSGLVTITDVGGDVQTGSFSNNLTVTGVKGHVTANAISDNVIIKDVGEGVRATSISGKIDITNVKGRIEVNTTSDSITLTDIDSKDILAKSTSGAVRFSGRFQAEGHYEFESFSSDVVLILPPDSSFRLSTKSHSGTVKTEFPIQLGAGVSTGVRGYLAGTVGNGGAEVRAATFSGNVFIRKSVK